MACTNDKPCCQPALRWVHSPVCVKLASQGKTATRNAERRAAAAREREAAAEPAPNPQPSPVGCGCGKALLSSRDEVRDGHRYGAPCEIQDVAVPASRTLPDGSILLSPSDVSLVPPTRAHRAGDQGLPAKGRGDILLELAQEAPMRYLERRKLGVERYGTPLQYGNGRDAGRDLEEELLDASAYARQLRGEHRDLQRQIQAYRVPLEARLGTLRKRHAGMLEARSEAEVVERKMLREEAAFLEDFLKGVARG